MSIRHCDKCGGRITFKKIDGRTVPIHLDGSCNQKNSNQGKLFEKNSQYESFTTPNANCPVCGAEVFYYENSYGSKVFFDSLGPPWPVHPCTDNEKTLNETSYKPIPNNKNVNNDDNLKGWKPFKIISRESFSGYSIFIVGIALSSNKTSGKIIEFKIDNSANIDGSIFELGVIYIRNKSTNGNSNIYEISILCSFKGKIGIKSLEGCALNNGSDGKYNSPTEKIHKRNAYLRKYGEKEKKISSTKECPICSCKVTHDGLDQHLKNKHWAKYKNGNKDYNKISHSFASKLDYETWKKLICS